MSEGNITYRGAVYPWHCDHVMAAVNQYIQYQRELKACSFPEDLMARARASAAARN